MDFRGAALRQHVLPTDLVAAVGLGEEPLPRCVHLTGPAVRQLPLAAPSLLHALAMAFAPHDFADVSDVQRGLTTALATLADLLLDIARRLAQGCLLVDKIELCARQLGRHVLACWLTPDNLQGAPIAKACISDTATGNRMRARVYGRIDGCVLFNDGMGGQMDVFYA